MPVELSVCRCSGFGSDRLRSRTGGRTCRLARLGVAAKDDRPRPLAALRRKQVRPADRLPARTTMHRGMATLAPPVRCVAAPLFGSLPLLIAGCGSSSDNPWGLTISGPALQTSQPVKQVSQPPWRPEYAHLAQRLKLIGIPPGGQEKFHIHAMLHIYRNGLLLPLPAEIGLDPAQGIESSMHTHDSTGIIHMEAPHPFSYTLGDFFAVWGVKLGPAQVGGLTGLGGDHLHFYVNGKPLSNPAAHVLHRYDSVVIGYGPDSSFPHNPS